MVVTSELGDRVSTAQPSLRAVRHRPGRRLLASWNARIGAGIIVVMITSALAAPLLAPYDPLALSAETLQPPSGRHLLGTDRLGRDVLSRLLYGARLSLLAALAATLIIVTIGVVVGALAGYLGGRVDTLLMRVVDGLLALPSLVLVLAIAGFFAPSLLTLILVLGLVAWGGYARIVRGLVLEARESEFVMASRALGGSTCHIVRRHIMPSVLPQVSVLATLEMGFVILAISGLSFLGLGAQPPAPEWGSMVNDGRTFFVSSPFVLLFSGTAIWLAVLGFNLLGDAFRDAVDPKLSDRWQSDRPPVIHAAAVLVVTITAAYRRLGKPWEAEAERQAARDDAP